ncbi:MAG: Lrp/AsnC family transcriptional regulator [Pseudomonas sp.]|uniref:Lrp/AsnC family transcriptional regulator n=1 Tax=Pseudomonas sp. TaxID=306 RepID=UPI003390CE1C
MDRYDRLILSALIEDGRLSFAELARRVNLSPPAVAERVAKLEANGVIRGYRAQVDLAKIGLPIECLIEVSISEHKSQSAALEALAAMPELSRCHLITGEACLVVQGAVASMPELQALINRISVYGTSKTSLILSSPFNDRMPGPLRTPSNGQR